MRKQLRKVIIITKITARGVSLRRGKGSIIMKRFKKITALLIASLMMLTAAACAFDEVDDNSGNEQTESSKQTESSEDKQSEEQSDSKEQQSEEQTEPDKETESASDAESETEEQKESESSSETETKAEEAEKETEDEGPDWDEIPAKDAPELKGDYTGSFTSNTETPLDLIVRWAASPSDSGVYKVTVQFFIKSYEIMAGERRDSAVTVKNGEGKTYTFTTYAVGKTSTAYGETYLGTTEFEISETDLKSGTGIEAVWNFKGNYAGKDLPVIKAEGVISAQ